MDTGISSLAADLNNANRDMLDRTMPALYADLRRLAQAYMRHERMEHTLQPTALAFRWVLC